MAKKQPKAKHGPRGNFVPADTGGRVDASRQVPTRWQHRVRHDHPSMGHVDLDRRSTSGKVDPTKYDLRRAVRRRKQEPERVDAFRPEKPRRLNEEGKRNKSMALPIFRHARGLDEKVLPFLVERGTLWRTKAPLHLSWCDDPLMPTLGWSSAQRINGRAAIPVPEGAFITYAGTRRVDARIHADEGERLKGVKEDLVGRCLQPVFLYGQHRCVVWEFGFVEPIPDDDDEENDDDVEQTPEDQ